MGITLQNLNLGSLLEVIIKEHNTLLDVYKSVFCRYYTYTNQRHMVKLDAVTGMLTQ